MSIAARYGALFQMSYATRDLDAAMAHARAALGIAAFHTSESELDVLCYGERRKLAVRAAIANIDGRQFEIIEPVSGAIEVYVEAVDLSANILNFHHIAIAVRGDYAEWQALLAEVAESGDAVAYLYPADQDPEQALSFCYVDTRHRLGHFTEYLWLAPALAGFHALPAEAP